MVSSYGIKKIIFTFIFSIFIIKCNHTDISKKENSPVLPNLENSDIVFRLGKGYFSNYFRKYASKDKIFSHIGIVSVENNNTFVYHSEASELTGVGGIKKELLTEFIKDSEKVAFFRTNLTPIEKEKIIQQVKLYHSKNITFDLSFDIHNNNEMYCTEFVAKSINNGLKKNIISPNLIIKDKYFYGLDDFYNNSLFTKID